MISLWFFPKLFLVLITNVVVSFRILLIGDSVDRYIVGDWCWNLGMDSDKSHANVWTNHWGASSGLQYGNINSKKQPAFICGSIQTNDTLAFVHTFGSNPTGPYYEGFTTNKDDPYADTPVRIQRAMEVYYEEYPVPDIIYYNSVQWDLHLLYATVNDTKALETPHSSLWNESIYHFEKNVNNRLDDILFHANRLSLIYGKLANVGIRTAPVNPRPNHLQSPMIAPENRLILAFNNVLRMMARDRNLTLYDMDNDIWSSMRWKCNTCPDEIVMRDFDHPTAEKAAVTGMKMLRWRYSSFLYDRGIYATDATYQHYGWAAIRRYHHHHDKLRFFLLLNTLHGRSIDMTTIVFLDSIYNSIRYRYVVGMFLVHS